jgi:hypothetical protein
VDSRGGGGAPPQAPLPLPLPRVLPARRRGQRWRWRGSGGAGRGQEAALLLAGCDDRRYDLHRAEIRACWLLESSTFRADTSTATLWWRWVRGLFSGAARGGRRLQALKHYQTQLHFKRAIQEASWFGLRGGFSRVKC